MPKTDPLVYTPMDYAVIHFGSPIGAKFTQAAPEEVPATPETVEETPESEGDK